MVTPQLLATHGAGAALPRCQEQHVHPPALQDKRLGREMSAWGREEGAVPAGCPAPGAVSRARGSEPSYAQGVCKSELSPAFKNQG